MKPDGELLRQAKWLREARQLFGIEAIHKTHECITINIEGQVVHLASLDRKLGEIKLGLAPEEEFLALSVWMGNCLAIHKLDQEVYPSGADQDYKVPDYLAIYRYKGQPVTVLVEVKSRFREDELEFTASYYEGLRNYAERVKHPLLIAWKYKDFGFWSLFEMSLMRKKVSAFGIPFLEALKNDLTGILLGNIHITVRAGSRFVMKVKRLGQESPDRFLGEISDVYWVNWRGQRISPEPKHFMLLFSHCEDEVSLREDGRNVTQTFYTTQDWTIIGYQLLPTALRFPKFEGKEQIDWMKFIRENSFPLTYADILRTANEGIQNGLVRYIIHQQPAMMPTFLSSIVGSQS